jgi:hypothetical protein
MEWIGRSSGLLPIRHLPIVDWTVVCRSNSREISRGAHSYGDSAGSSPVFPFKDAETSTNSRQM